jgi:hypothetical protein
MTITFEQEFWGNCANTFGEEAKQLVYARFMRLPVSGDWRSMFNIEMGGKSVIDIGGGPVSLLLKCLNVRGTVVDPLEYPRWVYARYAAANIRYIQMRGEDLLPVPGFGPFDEAWIYNCLQHVDDPEQIIRNARSIAKTIRMFEWIEIPPHLGHPQMLMEHSLAAALGGPGGTERLNGESGCFGRCFYGVFESKMFQNTTDEDEAEQAGKEAYSGLDLISQS